MGAVADIGLQEFEDRKIDFESKWGSRENVFSIKKKMDEIERLKRPVRVNEFSDQVRYLFSWMERVQDNRTREIVKMYKVPVWQEVDESETDKILKEAEEGLIDIRYTTKTLFFFDEEFLDAVMVTRHMTDLGEFRGVTDNFLFWTLGDMEDAENNYDFWFNRSELSAKFALSKGYITYEERLLYKTYATKHYSWTYKRALVEGNLSTRKREWQYLLMNVVYRVPGQRIRRKTEFVTELNCLYTELDYYKMKKYANSSHQYMKKKIFNKLESLGFPLPSDVFYSRGLQLVWRISPIGSRRAPYWEMLQKFIYNALEEFGADSKVTTDKVRVLRAVSSIHSKTKEAIYAHAYLKLGERYDFQELLETFCSKEVAERQAQIKESIEKAKEREEKRLKKLEEELSNPKPLSVIKGGKTGKVSKDKKLSTELAKNPWNLRHQRLVTDIFILLQLRKSKTVEGKSDFGGSRELACFLVRYWTMCITGGNKIEALNKMKEVYMSFDSVENDNGDRYTWETMLYLTESAEGGFENWKKHQLEGINNSTHKYAGYNYSTKRLIKEFKVTKEEMKVLNAIMDEEERDSRIPGNEARKYKRRKEKRRAEGVKEQGQSKQEKEDAITDVLRKNPKAKNKEIAEITGIKFKTVEAYAPKIRNKIKKP